MIRIAFTLLSFNLWLSGCTIVGTNDMPVAERKEAVRRSIAQHAPELKVCYENLLKDASILDGKVVLQWDIDEKGGARNIAIDESASQLRNADLNSCLTKVVAATTFPPSDGVDVHIRYPFVFSRVQ